MIITTKLKLIYRRFFMLTADDILQLLILVRREIKDNDLSHYPNPPFYVVEESRRITDDMLRLKVKLEKLLKEKN